MPLDGKLELLHSVSLFANLKGDDLVSLGQLADEVDVPAGKVLMRQGDYGREAFVVISGELAVERDGREIKRLGSGDTIGEMSLVSEAPRTATVTAVSQSRLFVLGHAEFHTLLEDSAEVRKCVMDEMARRLRELEVDRAH